MSKLKDQTLLFNKIAWRALAFNFIATIYLMTNRFTSTIKNNYHFSGTKHVDKLFNHTAKAVYSMHWNTSFCM